MSKIRFLKNDSMNMELPRDVLASSGYELCDVNSAAQALSNLILMDIHHPPARRARATRTLKQDPRKKDIIVIALTAHAMKGDGSDPTTFHRTRTVPTG